MEYLFLGGPKHGQMMEVADDVDHVSVPTRTEDTSGGIVMGTLVYMRRELNLRNNRTGENHKRTLFAAADLPAQMAEVLLGELFVMLWIMEGDPKPQLQLQTEPISFRLEEQP